MSIRGTFNNCKSYGCPFMHQSIDLIPWNYHRDLLFDTQAHAYFEIKTLINLHPMRIIMPQKNHIQTIVNDAIMKMIYQAKHN